MSIIKASGAPAIRVIDGITYTFPLLKRKQIGALLAKWAAEDRARLVKILTESGASATEKLDKLTTFDQESRLISYGHRCLFEYDRTIETLIASTSEELVESLPLTVDELCLLACELWGWKIREKAEGDEGGEKKADPTKPGTVVLLGPNERTGSSSTPT